MSDARALVWRQEWQMNNTVPWIQGLQKQKKWKRTLKIKHLLPNVGLPTNQDTTEDQSKNLHVEEVYHHHANWLLQLKVSK